MVSGAKALRVAGSTVVLAGSLAGLHAAGHGSLVPPDLTAPETWPAWATARSPAAVAFACVRLVALALGWYLVVVGGLGVLARVARRPVLDDVVARLCLPGLRPLLRAVVGVSLLAPPVTASVVRMAPAAAQSPAQRIDVPTDVPTMRRLPESASFPAGPPAPAPTAPPPVEVWVVAPGEHFWLAAQRTLTHAWGRQPSPREVVPYWRMLIDVNRGRLVRADDPNLVRPGQVFRLPLTPPTP